MKKKYEFHESSKILLIIVEARAWRLNRRNYSYLRRESTKNRPLQHNQRIKYVRNILSITHPISIEIIRMIIGRNHKYLMHRNCSV